MTDIAFISTKALGQFEMVRADAAMSPLLLSPHVIENVALQF